MDAGIFLNGAFKAIMGGKNLSLIRYPQLIDNNGPLRKMSRIFSFIFSFIIAVGWDITWQTNMVNNKKMKLSYANNDK